MVVKAVADFSIRCTSRFYFCLIILIKAEKNRAQDWTMGYTALSEGKSKRMENCLEAGNWPTVTRNWHLFKRGKTKSVLKATGKQ